MQYTKTHGHVMGYDQVPIGGTPRRLPSVSKNNSHATDPLPIMLQWSLAAIKDSKS